MNSALLTRLSLFIRFDPQTGQLEGSSTTERRLSDLNGCFADDVAYQAHLSSDDPVVYTVSAVTRAEGEGQLHFGLGALAPGRIGDEYFMTKGHLHTWRAAAEIYIGLSGEGAMLLEDEQTGESRLVPLTANSIVYVPGHTAHRTINTGETPLRYLGIYPADAGHDYGAIVTRNFRKLVVARDGAPTLVDRADYAVTSATH